MGRRSINTTKSGKFMNPTDQARMFNNTMIFITQIVSHFYTLLATGKKRIAVVRICGCRNRYVDYICRENSRQIAIIDYLFSVNFHGSIFLLLDINSLVNAILSSDLFLKSPVFKCWRCSLF